MEKQVLMIGAAAVSALVFAGTLFGFFMSKSSGFGPYNTSTLILILVLFVAVLGFLTGSFESQMANLLFAIAGYAGGVLTGKNEPPST